MSTDPQHLVLVDAAQRPPSRSPPWPSSPSRTVEAWRDLRVGIDRYWIWSAGAIQDVRLRYRGSLLGPFWVTISNVILVACMGIIWARLFHQDVHTFLPYLVSGLTLWQLIAALITEGCQTFIGASDMIQQVCLPFSVHAYRVVCRNLIVLAHTAVVIPAVLLIFQVSPGFGLLALPAALALLALNGVWIAILFGMVSARFRDIPPIVASILSVMMLITPIFWPIDALGTWKWAIALNPIFAAIDVFRAPLLGVPPEPWSWTILVAGTLVGCGATFALFARYRERIAFWI